MPRRRRPRRCAAGVVLNPPTDVPGIGRLAIIADPHGAVTAIMKPVPPSDARPRAPRGAVGHAGWHQLYAGDADADLAFYRALFGWTETGRHDMGPMGVYHLFSNADGEVGGSVVDGRRGSRRPAGATTSRPTTSTRPPSGCNGPAARSRKARRTYRRAAASCWRQTRKAPPSLW